MLPCFEYVRAKRAKEDPVSARHSSYALCANQSGMKCTGGGCGPSVNLHFEVCKQCVSGIPFGDIWCLFVSFGPAPHIYLRGERVRGPVRTIHGHYPESTWSSVRQASEVPGTGPTLSAYT